MSNTDRFVARWSAKLPSRLLQQAPSDPAVVALQAAAYIAEQQAIAKNDAAASPSRFQMEDLREQNERLLEQVEHYKQRAEAAESKVAQLESAQLKSDEKLKAAAMEQERVKQQVLQIFSTTDERQTEAAEPAAS